MNTKSCEPLRIVEMVFPNTTNHYGTMFGGKVLDLMDRAAFLVCTRFTGQAVVTASMEHIDFYVPIKSGNLVELVAQVVYTGRTSMTAKVDLYSENPLRHTRKLACQGYFNMVSVDEDGKATAVPTLEISGDEQRAEWEHVRSLLAFRKERRGGRK